MTISGSQITAWVGTYLWTLFRVGAALGIAPMFSMQMVPVRVRLGLAVVLTLIIGPIVPPAPPIDPLSVTAVLVAAQQILVGAAMGFVMLMVFAMFVHAGQIIALQIGLGFASMVDPQNGVQVPIVSEFYVILVMLVYLAFDGHLALIEVLVESFHLIPVSTSGLTVAGLELLLAWGSDLFSGAMRIALPVVAAMLLVNLALGVMSRAAPQLNIFAVGFPVSLLFGFVVILYALPAQLGAISALHNAGMDLIGRVLQLGAP
jgi:flagellar biosynthetic protein FliR